jgi:hypothetical protein
VVILSSMMAAFHHWYPLRFTCIVHLKFKKSEC